MDKYEPISIDDVAAWLSTQGVPAEARTMGEFSVLSLQQAQNLHLEIATSAQCTRRRKLTRCCNNNNNNEEIYSVGSGEEEDFSYEEDEDEDDSGNISPVTSSSLDYQPTTLEDTYLKLEEDLNSPSPSPSSPFHAKVAPDSVTMLVDLTNNNDPLLQTLSFTSDVGHSSPNIPNTIPIPSPSFEIVPNQLSSSSITPPAHIVKLSPSPNFNQSPSPSPSPSVAGGIKRKSKITGSDLVRRKVPEVKLQDRKKEKRQPVESEVEPEDLVEEDAGGKLGTVTITRQRHLDSRWPVPIKLTVPFAANKWFKVTQEVDECPKLKEGGTWYDSPTASYSPYDISSTSYEEIFLVVSEDRIKPKESCCSKERCHFATSRQPLVSFQTSSAMNRYFQLNEKGETQLRIWLNLNPSHGTNGRGSRIYLAFFKRCPATSVTSRLTCWTHVENTRKRVKSDGSKAKSFNSGNTLSIPNSPSPPTPNVPAFPPPSMGFHFTSPLYPEMDFFSDRLRSSTFTLETLGIEQLSSDQLKSYSSRIVSTYYHQRSGSSLPFPLSLFIPDTSPSSEVPFYLPEKCEVVVKVLDIEAHGQKVLDLLKNLLSPPSSSSSSSSAQARISLNFQQLPVLHDLSSTTKIVSSQVLLTALFSCIQEAKYSSNPHVLICPWVLFQAGEAFQRLLKLARSVDSLLIVASSTPYKSGLHTPPFMAPAGCADVLTVGATDGSELPNKEEKDEWSSVSPTRGKHFAWLYGDVSGVVSTSVAATVVGFHSALLWMRNWDLPSSFIAQQVCNEINAKSSKHRQEANQRSGETAAHASSQQRQQQKQPTTPLPTSISSSTSTLTTSSTSLSNSSSTSTIPAPTPPISSTPRVQENRKEEGSALFVQQSHSRSKLIDASSIENPPPDRRFIRSRMRVLFVLFVLPSIIFAIFTMIPPDTLRHYLPASIAPASTSHSFGGPHSHSASPEALLEGSHFTMNLTHYGDEKKPTKRAKLKYFFEDQFGKFKDMFARKRKRTTTNAESYESSEKLAAAVLVRLTHEEEEGNAWKEVEEVHLISKGPNHLQIYTKPPLKSLALDTSMQEALVRRIVKEPAFEPSFASHYVLRWACLHGQMELIQQLINERKDYKFDPSVMDQEPLRLAIKGNHLSIVKLLLEDPRTDPVMSLNHASSHGRNEIVRELLSNHPGVNPTAAVLHARSSMKNQTIDLLLEDSRVNPLVILNFATSIGDYELANKVLPKVPTSARGFALMAAKATNIYPRLKLYKGLYSNPKLVDNFASIPPQVTLDEVWAENQETSDRIGQELAKLRWQMEHFTSCTPTTSTPTSTTTRSPSESESESESSQLFAQEKEGMCSLSNLEALFEKALRHERNREEALSSLWQDIATIKTECEKPTSSDLQQLQLQQQQLVVAA